VSLMGGQWHFHLVRSEHKLALTLGEQMEKIGEARNDVELQLVGCRWQAVSHCSLGEFVAARASVERCRGLRDWAHRVHSATMFEDPYALLLVQHAMTLAYLGYIDEARSRLAEALLEARRLEQPGTMIVVLLLSNWTESIICSPDLQRTGEIMALSTEHSFPGMLAWALTQRGRSLAILGQAQEGLMLLTQGLDALRAAECVLHTPTALAWQAEAHAMLGQPVEGLTCLAEAAQFIETTEERVHEAELYRVRGDLLNATGDRSAAERNYSQALSIAAQQSAKLFELQAATSLARLWRDQDKRAEARDLLAPIYNWFIEGFDAPDLIEQADRFGRELRQLRLVVAERAALRRAPPRARDGVPAVGRRLPRHAGAGIDVEHEQPRLPHPELALRGGQREVRQQRPGQVVRGPVVRVGQDAQGHPGPLDTPAPPSPPASQARPELARQTIRQPDVRPPGRRPQQPRRCLRAGPAGAQLAGTANARRYSAGGRKRRGD